ncbi:MAG: hypothetical protein OXC14_12315 [Rhodospirillaceae bacterium]|nr:hypothetical protein [Rhodospirillaceae bacterium]
MTDTNGGTRDVELWLRENSKCRRQAVEFWSLLLDDAHPDNGQITLTRDQIATQLDIAPGNVSRIMIADQCPTYTPISSQIGSQA